MKLSAPILLLIFNRPDTTKRVFDAIRRARPSRLFVAADGPRDGRPDEKDRCAQTRKIVVQSVDWDCEVEQLFREKNLGCKKAVSSAIDWFFENVEEGIILEDDCLPSQSFFGYCQELLEYYRNDTRVMQICGSNLLKEWDRSSYSYLFSNYGPIWGWASWRRAWEHYDVGMRLWPEIRENKFYLDFCQSAEEANYRLDLYDKVYGWEVDTWDYQWGFAKMINNGLSITPRVNMVKNIGFGADATHCNNNSPFANIEMHEITLPLSHPQYVLRDKRYDMNYNKLYVPSTKKSIYERMKMLLNEK